jgi:hypothetical protein
LRVKSHAMSRPVIPVPARFRGDASKFVLRSRTRIVHADVGVAGMVERLCSDVARRTDLRLVPVLGDPPSDEQAMGASAVLGATTGSDARGDVFIYSAAAACDTRVRNPADLW